MVGRSRELSRQQVAAEVRISVPADVLRLLLVFFPPCTDGGECLFVSAGSFLDPEKRRQRRFIGS